MLVIAMPVIKIDVVEMSIVAAEGFDEFRRHHRDLRRAQVMAIGEADLLVIATATTSIHNPRSISPLDVAMRRN